MQHRRSKGRHYVLWLHPHRHRPCLVMLLRQWDWQEQQHQDRRKKKRQHRSVERAGEDGEKERVESKVILNMIDYPINAEQYPVTAEEEAEIKIMAELVFKDECKYTISVPMHG